jgi:hypothetical protein
MSESDAIAELADIRAALEDYFSRDPVWRGAGVFTAGQLVETLIRRAKVVPDVVAVVRENQALTRERDAMRATCAAAEAYLVLIGPSEVGPRAAAMIAAVDALRAARAVR